jgi:hypothetical protein
MFRPRSLPGRGADLRKERPSSSHRNDLNRSAMPPVIENQSLDSSFSKSLRFAQVNNQIDTSQVRRQSFASNVSLRQYTSFSGVGQQNRTMTGANIQRPLDPIHEASMSQRSLDLAPTQRTMLNLIEKKSFEEKQADISAIRKAVEAIAQRQSDSARNDLAIQLDSRQ